MRQLRTTLAGGFTLALASLATAGAGAARDLPKDLVKPGAYQSFVKNWTPEGKSFCAVLTSPADWDAVMGAAPVMGPHKPFAPPPAFWSRHALLLVARVTPAGNLDDIFEVEQVSRSPHAIEVRYRFHPPTPGSSTIKAWIGVQVVKPLARTVRFQGDDGDSCTAKRP